MTVMRVQVEPGVELNVQDLGEGRPVVFIAGFGLDHEVWDAQVRLLTGAGLRTVCIDQRGHGYSDKPLAGYEVERLAEDAAAVLDALDLDDATLVGFSFGGQVAFRLAATHPERLRALVLVGSNAVRASRAEGFPFGIPASAVAPALIAAERNGRVAARRETLAAAFAAEPDPDQLAWLLRISLRMPSWAAVACYESMLNSDLLDDLPKVTLPVLQIMGVEDPVHSPRATRWLNEQLPDAELVELRGCGHYPMLEAAGAFNAALCGFLEVGYAGRMTPESPLTVGSGPYRSEPLELVEAFYAAMAAKDPEEVAGIVGELFAPDARLIAPPPLPHAGVTDGLESLRKLFVAGASPDIKYGASGLTVDRVVEAQLDDEHELIVEISFDWSMPGVEPVRTSAVEWWRFRDAKAFELKAYYWDAAGIMPTAG